MSVYKMCVCEALRQGHPSTGVPSAVSLQQLPAPTNIRNKMKVLKNVYV